MDIMFAIEDLVVCGPSSATDAVLTSTNRFVAIRIASRRKCGVQHAFSSVTLSQGEQCK